MLIVDLVISQEKRLKVMNEKTNSNIRPKVGTKVNLYPHKPWMIDGSGEEQPIREYVIAEWVGNTAHMECGARFRWNPGAGFLL
jgi:hypothetical protein